MKRVMMLSVLLLLCMCGSLQEEAPPRRVMIDISHSMQGANPEINMVAISKVLTSFTFEAKNELLTETLTKEYDVVMLYQPFSNLEDSEIEALLSFVRKGGGLIICGENDVGWNDASRSTFNKLGATFGISFDSNAIDDPTNKAGCYCTPIIHNLAVHPLTEGVSQIVMYRPCSLQLSGTAIAIARGDEDTRTVGLDIVEGENVVAAAVTDYEKGRVVAIGSYTVFDDSYISQPNNFEFSINTFNWVSEHAGAKGPPLTTLIAAVVIAGLLVLIIALRKF